MGMYMNDPVGHLALIFPPITTIYLLILIPELLDDGGSVKTC